jgi:hypothetical protein
LEVLILLVIPAKAGIQRLQRYGAPKSLDDRYAPLKSASCVRRNNGRKRALKLSVSLKPQNMLEKRVGTTWRLQEGARSPRPLFLAWTHRERVPAFDLDQVS